MSVESVQMRIAAIRQFAAPSAAPPRAASAASFDSVLREAMAPSEQGVVSSSGAPSELARFGNGKIPASVLAPVGKTGHRMWAPAADALNRLVADAAADGVHIGITDSYRPLDAQVRVAQEKGLYRNGGLAAVPGTSTHGWGRSADLDLSPKAQAWMRANAATYGFENDVAREPWHWTYTPST